MSGLDDLQVPYEISSNKDVQNVLTHLIEETEKIEDSADLDAAQVLAHGVATELERLRSAMNY